MALTPAQKQRRYRQRKALERVSNGYAVTLLRKVEGDTQIIDTLTEFALEIYDAGGDGALFLERAAILCYPLLSTAKTLKAIWEQDQQASTLD